ncbi:NUDIX domain-containing protein [Nocardioides sp. BP30]|uniref:NUDIX hydrolase n=1 Tax=Nocardioides sp. BP30 TaxID=3036374 RepID=UPI0024694EC3|nr:NUDIX domain-containing protein [Nocardioides sp. BP30]WGL51438.1 NUDIX domain-containing protein [Nocardioides sp. BP30]
MSLREDALRTLASWSPPTVGQQELRQRYVDYLTRHASGVLREDRPHHLTASTLVLSADGAQVMLTLHAKAQRWFQFGGHLEPGDASLLAAATREASEESGLAGLTLDPAPVQLSDHEVPFCGPGVHHYDVRFVAVAAAGAVPAVSEESLDVRWFPVAALPSEDPDMLELIDLARRRLAETSPFAG